MMRPESSPVVEPSQQLLVARPGDLVVASVTGVDVCLPVAGPGARAFAFILDWLFRAILATAWFVVAALLHNRRWSLAQPRVPDAAWFVAVVAPALTVYFLYHPIFELAAHGSTPGKRMAGVRLVSREATAPDFWAVLIRNVFRIVDSFPLLYGVGLTATITTCANCRIGDLAAGTLLVYDRSDLGPRLPAQPSASVQRRKQPWQSIVARAQRLAAGRLPAAPNPTRTAPAPPRPDAIVMRAATNLPAAAADAIRAPIAKTVEPAFRASATSLRSVADALQLIADYTRLAHDLARARTRAANLQDREYLECAYARVHVTIYRSGQHIGHQLLTLFRDEIPAVVGELKSYILWSSTLFVLTVACGFGWVQRYPALIALFASPELIASVHKGHLWTEGLLNIVPSSILSLQILANNIAVSLFAYCAGFLFGLGTFYILGLNGLMLGAVFAFTAQYGLDADLFRFIVAHGLVETSVMCLSGAAGAAVGDALLRPQQASRSESFRLAALKSGKLLAACVVLLIGSGWLEGYVSPDPDIATWARVSIGAGYWIFMLALLRGWLFRPWTKARRMTRACSDPSDPAQRLVCADD